MVNMSIELTYTYIVAAEYFMYLLLFLFYVCGGAGSICHEHSRDILTHPPHTPQYASKFKYSIYLLHTILFCVMTTKFQQ